MSIEKFTIGIVKPNKFDISDVDLSDTVKLKSMIRDMVSQHIEFVEISSPDEMMCTVIDTIGLKDHLKGDTDQCYETSTNLYQLCHLNMENNGQKDNEEDINRIGCYLTGNKVYKSAVFINCMIGEDYRCVSASVDLNNIVDIIFSKVVHKGVHIPIDGSVEEITFNKSPIESFSKQEVDNMRFIEIPFLKFNLVGIVKVDLDEEEDKINRRATRLAGNARIHGPMILVSKSTEHEFIDFDLDVYKKLLAVAGGTSENRNLEDIEDKDEEDHKLPIVMTRYTVLDRRFARLDSTLCSCGTADCSIGEEGLFCTGCYRMRYRSEECHKEHWKKHKYDCLHGKDSINSVIKKKDGVIKEDNKIEVV